MVKKLFLITFLLVFKANFVLAATDYSYEKVVFNDKKDNFYEVQVEYPQITDERISQKLRLQVNNKIKKLVNSLYVNDLKSFKSSPSITEEPIFSTADVVNINFEIIRFDDNFLSIKFDKYFYGRGAAHGLEEIIGFNYDFKRNRLSKLKDFFNSKSGYLKKLSKLSIANLEKQLKAKSNFVDSAWLKDGAAPTRKNFEQFGVGQNELILYFNVYQVACYADGSQEVKIPFGQLNEKDVQ